MRNLQVNGERLWASLMELAEIGATEKGGVCRLAASDVDKAATVRLARVRQHIGRVDRETMNAVGAALARFLGLD